VPGTPAAGAPSALQAALLMSPAPKPEPGTATGKISTSAAGVPRYQLPLAFTYLLGPSGRKISQLISVTVATPRAGTRHPIGFPGDVRWPALRPDPTAGT
jgi:hypothetical protein